MLTPLSSSFSSSSQWHQFIELLLNEIENPDNRQQTVAQASKDARQAPSQSAAHFLAHIETLERDLPPFTEHQKLQNFWTGIRPNLQNAIQITGKSSGTCEEMVKLATRLEKAKQSGNGK